MSKASVINDEHGRVQVMAMLPSKLLERVQSISAATGVATRDVITLCLYVGLSASQQNGVGDQTRRNDDNAEEVRR